MGELDDMLRPFMEGTKRLEEAMAKLPELQAQAKQQQVLERAIAKGTEKATYVSLHADGSVKIEFKTAEFAKAFYDEVLENGLDAKVYVNLQNTDAFMQGTGTEKKVKD